MRCSTLQLQSPLVGIVTSKPCPIAIVRPYRNDRSPIIVAVRFSQVHVGHCLAARVERMGGVLMPRKHLMSAAVPEDITMAICPRYENTVFGTPWPPISCAIRSGISNAALLIE